MTRMACALSLAVVLAVGLASLSLLTATSAAAHVTVAAPGASIGAADAVITFRVPNEKPQARTVGLTIALPLDTPIAGVKVADKPGWSATTTQATLRTPLKTDDGEIETVVSRITWTAPAGGGVRPGYFGEFTIIAGKLPDDTAEVTFKAIQTYSDGTTASWIQIAAPSSNTEPEDPAPVLTLAPPVTATPASPAAGRSVGTGSPSAAESTNDISVLDVVTLALAAVAVILSAGALTVAIRRSRAGSTVRPDPTP